MDAVCQKDGCYMFGPDSPFRESCEMNCRLHRCECGHTHGDHYIKPGWPACGKCTGCREFRADKKAPSP